MKTKKLVSCPQCGGFGFTSTPGSTDYEITVCRAKTCELCHGAGVIEVPTTNTDRIRSMSDEELSEFLSSIAYGRETPWSEPFDEKFCKSCPTTTCTVEGYHHPMDLHECDFTDGKCPHGRDIVWWLQQPAGEEDKHEAD